MVATNPTEASTAQTRATATESVSTVKSSFEVPATDRIRQMTTARDKCVVNHN